MGLRCLNAWTTLIILFIYIYIFVKGRSTGNPHRIRSKNVCTAIVHHQPLQNLMLIEPLFFPWLGSRVCEIRVSLSHSSGLSPYMYQSSASKPTDTPAEIRYSAIRPPPFHSFLSEEKHLHKITNHNLWLHIPVYINSNESPSFLLVLSQIFPINHR